MWWDDAACLGLAPQFDADHDDGLSAGWGALRMAAKVCAACPVLVDCGSDAFHEQATLPPWRKPVGVRAGWLFQHGRAPKRITAPPSCGVCGGPSDRRAAVCVACEQREALARLDRSVPLPLIPAQRTTSSEQVTA